LRQLPHPPCMLVNVASVTLCGLALLGSGSSALASAGGLSRAGSCICLASPALRCRSRSALLRGACASIFCSWFTMPPSPHVGGVFQMQCTNKMSEVKRCSFNQACECSCFRGLALFHLTLKACASPSARHQPLPVPPLPHKNECCSCGQVVGDCAGHCAARAHPQSLCRA
jgi:hypothetical protein